MIAARYCLESRGCILAEGHPDKCVVPAGAATLRDYFAAAALTGVMRSYGTNCDWAAEVAYTIADAMLAERECKTAPDFRDLLTRCLVYVDPKSDLNVQIVEALK